MVKRKKKVSGVLKKITTRAKQIYNKGGEWKNAIKKASAEYRSGCKSKKVGAYKVIEKGEKKSTPAKRVYRNVRTKKGRFNKTQRVGLIPGTAVMTTVNGIGNVSVGAMKGAIRMTAKSKLAGALLRRDLATTKRDKRKITKQVIEYRKEVKKYS